MICESEAYHSCLATVVLQKNFRCKYQNHCLEMMVQDAPWMLQFYIQDEKIKKFFRGIIDTYCSSIQNHVLNAKTKLLEQGIIPPVELMPDERKLRFRDILFEKELTIE